ncbi:cytochrome P460 family protein [Zhouia sp. PK063]|uniref:cytochrome P460 family protein n=1 Tax=Zhouia sp. PK063 TaxID=3373602 RepID=UPI00378E62F8
MKRFIYLFIVAAGCCIGCTTPTESLNTTAAIVPGKELQENPLLQYVISSAINVHQQTMSTLYGNAKAYEYAKGHGDGKYPQGAVLYEVTWHQQNDPTWFGAKIPGKPAQVTVVKFTDDAQHQIQAAVYTGAPLHLQKTIAADAPQVQQLLKTPIAVSP